MLKRCSGEAGALEGPCDAHSPQTRRNGNGVIRLGLLDGAGDLDHRHTGSDQGHWRLLIVALGNNRTRTSHWRLRGPLKAI